MDITNPETPPTLLGEFTKTIDDSIVADLNGDGLPDESAEVELGYTTVISTMVPMKTRDEAFSNEDRNCDGNTANDPAISKWSLVLGSGPTELDGTSDQYGSVSIIPLERFVSKDSMTDPKKNMRIPAAAPAVDASPWTTRSTKMLDSGP